MNLPPMPEPKEAAAWRYRPADASDDWRLIVQPWEEELHSARWEHEPLFTAAQLRDYGAACYAAGMEAAAKVCWSMRAGDDWRDCADAIRAAMPPKP